MTVVNLS